MLGAKVADAYRAKNDVKLLVSTETDREYGTLQCMEILISWLRLCTYLLTPGITQTGQHVPNNVDLIIHCVITSTLQLLFDLTLTCTNFW